MFRSECNPQEQQKCGRKGFPLRTASKHQGQPDQLPENEDMAPSGSAMSRRRGLLSEVRRTVPIYSTWAVISSAAFGCSSEEALAFAFLCYPDLQGDLNILDC